MKRTEHITEADLLIFQGGATSGFRIIKEGRKYIEIRATGNQMKYRFQKGTGAIQSSPYWNTIEGMYIEGKEG